MSRSTRSNPKLDSSFNSTTRTRGREYFSERRVTLIDTKYLKPGEIAARVNGSSGNYLVLFQRDSQRLAVSCECPAFSQWGPCKHIYATLLEATSRDRLDAAGLTEIDEVHGRDDSRFEPGDYDLDDDLDTDFEPWQPGSTNPRREPERLESRLLPHQRDWRRLFSHLTAVRDEPGDSPANPDDQILYLIDVHETIGLEGIVLRPLIQRRKKDGTLGKPAHFSVHVDQIRNLHDPADQEVFALLYSPSDATMRSSYSHPTRDTVGSRHELHRVTAAHLIPKIASTGRLVLQLASGQLVNVSRWDDGGAWKFVVAIARSSAENDYVVRGELEREGQRISVLEPHLLLAGSLVFLRDTVAALDDSGNFAWIYHFRNPITSDIRIPANQAKDAVFGLMTSPGSPPLILPEELRVEQIEIKPSPRLELTSTTPRWGPARLEGHLSFDYDGTITSEMTTASLIRSSDGGAIILRDRAAERTAADRLLAIGFRRSFEGDKWEVTPRRFAASVAALVEEEWEVHAEGARYVTHGVPTISMTTGVDWFELDARVPYGTSSVTLPKLLAAAKKKEGLIRLDDGSLGILPAKWLARYSGLLSIAHESEGELRFRKNQIGLIDALLATRPEIDVDQKLRRAKVRLAAFDGIRATKVPAGFKGVLRDYQRDALGWFRFLRDFGFGGCLADDMGLGKTVQVLALLQSRRGKPSAGLASLVVVPRSLIFNWKSEISRFTPKQKVLDHTGPTRAKSIDAFAGWNIVLTTYGTLRRDAALFSRAEFDYAILDEAQAIKNAAAQTSKAARLLRARYYLGLSGTPIENHLGELWSLFEFLNPGMLGTFSKFRKSGFGSTTADSHSRETLSRGLRPFILRRTKDEVASELPPKTEQTLYCELDRSQRKEYDQLRTYYQRLLTQKIADGGMGKAKIHVLEALLRLRQAACHPGLMDGERFGDSSAKLDMLLEEITLVIEEGHKVLVFSQFTKFLGIVRDRIERLALRYTYLDGQTRNREETVGQFQSDPETKLFLISLKAGGLGLNLTEADYVFLLDPWWNPAVETQAIDRTHRIGQERHVFAYRMVVRDTVEERILELQAQKRDLADAIITADNSLIRKLSRDDLDLLLS